MRLEVPFFVAPGSVGINQREQPPIKMNTIIINEQNLGTDATEQDAREMVRLLCNRGIKVWYGDKIPHEGDKNANAIPDSIWTECLNEIIAKASL